jgi:hypothetical protein
MSKIVFYIYVPSFGVLVGPEQFCKDLLVLAAMAPGSTLSGNKAGGVFVHSKVKSSDPFRWHDMMRCGAEEVLALKKTSVRTLFLASAQGPNCMDEVACVF